MGSNFLVEHLRSHPNVVCYGELFRHPNSIGWDMTGFPSRCGESFRLYSKKPVGFLKEYIWSPQPPSVSAVGFKLFYYHAKGEYGNLVWNYLESLPDLKVVHIKRRNILQSYLSRIKANQSGHWKYEGGSRSWRPVALSFEECREVFERTRHYEKVHDSRFAGRCKSVYYEDLASGTETTMRDVLHFLQLPLVTTHACLRKQNRMPLRSQISNYDDLRSRFEGTEWSVFFDE